MSDRKNTLFTIGQFAALHEINKKTLMWYDEVGLFHPAVIGENGYRYYTYHQSPALETILMLRELNVSIHEIQTFVENRSAENLKTLLEEKISELDRNIFHLKAIRKSLVHQKDEMSLLLNMDISEISVIEKEMQYLVAVPTAKQISFEKEVEMIVSEAKKNQLQHLHNNSYGSMISVDSLYRGEFDDYAALFMKIRNPVTQKGLHIQPEGKYLLAFCKGSWDKLPNRYKELLQYAKEHNLVLTGCAYEMGINEIVINSMDDYITQIEIQIKTE